MFQAIMITVLIIINLLAVYSVFIEPHWIEVTHSAKTIAGVPADLDGLTIVHLSDVHMDAYGAYERRIVRETNALKPDIVCVTGDLINYRRDFKHAIRFLNDLKTRCGVFVVYGNAEYHSFRYVEEALRSEPLNAAVHILRNDIVRVPIGDGAVMIYGLDDPVSGAAQYKILERMPEPGSVSMVLTHCYVISDEMPSFGAFDVVFAGHTHGGQVRILPDRVMRRWLSNEYHMTIPYISGRHDVGDTSIFVSRGLGMSALPVRFNVRPQVGVVRVKVQNRE